jgi:hypothetical protein
MSKPLLKSHILLGDKLLGSLFYFKDTQNRSSLKLSFKNKLGSFTMWADSEHLKDKLALPPSNEDVSFDLSYKFTDNLLEVKRQVGTKIERHFHKVPFPPKNYLFILKIKDWHILNDAVDKTDTLTLNLPNHSKSVSVFFSFLGTNGLPFAPEDYMQDMGRTVSADLPEADFPKICIWTVEDKDNNEPYNLVIKIPYYPEVTE